MTLHYYLHLVVMNRSDALPGPARYRFRKYINKLWLQARGYEVYQFPTLREHVEECALAVLRTDPGKLTEKIRGWLRDKDILDLSNCERCSAAYISDEGSEVTTAVHTSSRRPTRTEHWCPACVSGSSHTCSECEEQFVGDCSYSMVAQRNRTRLRICVPCYENGDSCMCCECGYVIDNDSAIYREDGDSGPYCSGCDPGEPEEPDADESGRIPGYHSEQRAYRVAEEAVVFGVELEVLANTRLERFNIWQIANDAGMIGEEDGSLDDQRGIELVGPPLTLAENRIRWLPLLERIRGKAVGWNAGTGYGMHVSLNRRSMTTLHQGKLLVFVHGSRALCETVAGRSENNWTLYKKKTLRDAEQDGGDKYEALAIRSRSRLECRIFRSTLSPEGFQRNLEFVAAAVEFTRNAESKDLTHDGLLSWLVLNAKGCLDAGKEFEYANLAVHLTTERSARRLGRKLKIEQRVPEGSQADRDDNDADGGDGVLVGAGVPDISTALESVRASLVVPEPVVPEPVVPDVPLSEPLPDMEMGRRVLQRFAQSVGCLCDTCRGADGQPRLTEGEQRLRLQFAPEEPAVPFISLLTTEPESVFAAMLDGNDIVDF